MSQAPRPKAGLPRHLPVNRCPPLFVTSSKVQNTTNGHQAQSDNLLQQAKRNIGLLDLSQTQIDFLILCINVLQKIAEGWHVKKVLGVGDQKISFKGRSEHVLLSV